MDAIGDHLLSQQLPLVTFEKLIDKSVSKVAQEHLSNVPNKSKSARRKDASKIIQGQFGKTHVAENPQGEVEKAYVEVRRVVDISKLSVADAAVVVIDRTFNMFIGGKPIYHVPSLKLVSDKPTNYLKKFYTKLPVSDSKKNE